MNDIENILVNAAHSKNKEIEYLEGELDNERLFCKILELVEDIEVGDARMEGAFWISKFDISIIEKYEERLLNLMDEELDSIVVHIMIALSRIKSKKCFQMIVERKIMPVFYWEGKALENYYE